MENVIDKVKIYSSFQENLSPLFYFSGIAFRDGDVFIGHSEDEEFIKSIEDLCEGRFFLAFTNKNKTIFKTDDTGQELLFYYNNGNDWAISNSFKKICEHLYDNKVELTVNYASLISFQGDHSFCESLVGNRTVINEIKILDSNQYVKVMDRVNFNIIERKEINCDKELIEVAKDYINSWTSRLKTLVDYLPSGSIKCDLTGGMDSRLILALLLASKSDLKKVDFVSNPLATADLEIAQLLANDYGLKLNEYDKTEQITLTAEEQLELTLYSSLGVYHGFYIPLNISNKLAIHLHGGGGGLFRQVYNSNFEQILLNQCRFFPNKTFLARSIEQLIKFDREKIDHYNLPPAERSITYFYETRNRYHFGRNWFKSIERNLVTPLISQDVLSMRMLSKEVLDDKELYLLLFLLIEPQLLQYSFDRDDKNFSLDSIKKVRKIISEQSLGSNHGSLNKGKVFTQFDAIVGEVINKPQCEKQSAIQLLYDHAEAAYKYINKSYLSTEFQKTTEEYLEKKILTKKACRSYLYLYLLGFLEKVTVKRNEYEFHHQNSLAKIWDKSIYKNSPTIVNSLSNRGVPYISESTGKTFVTYFERQYEIQQNIINNGRYRQPLFLDKVLTKEKLEGVVNIAEGKVFNVSEVSDAWNFLRSLKTKSGVVKPISGVGGYGITTNITTYEQLENAICLIKDQNFLLEEFYKGDDCRIYVVGGKAIAAAIRKPPEIVGNGVSTIADLIKEKKLERSQKAYFKKHEIEIDEKIYLKYKSDMILPKGKIVQLNDTGNISRGGESYDVTDKMHFSFQDIAAACWLAYSCHPDHFAIDIICEDISIDISSQNYAVLELNAKPGHGQHVYPYEGASRRLTDEIVDYWFPVN